MKIFRALLILLFASSCASVGTVSDDYSASRLAGDSLLVLSVTNRNAGYFNGVNQFPPNLKIRNTDTGDSFTLKGLVGTAWDRHLENEKGWTIGRVIAMELPPGNYQVYDWEAVKAPLHVYGESVDKPEIVFELFPGQATYIGNIDLYINPDTEKYLLNVYDERERDFKEVRAKWPSLDVEKIEISLAREHSKAS